MSEKIRVIDNDGNEKEADINYACKSVVHLKLMATNIVVSKHNGQPYGSRSVYRVHPDDLPKIQNLEKTTKKHETKRRVGIPSGWNV